MSVRYLAGEELKKFLTGNELLSEKKDRDASADLLQYLRSEPDGSILCLNGVRLSGRIVMMHRAIMELGDYEQTGFVYIGSTEKGDTDRIVKLSTEKKYTFIYDTYKCGDIVRLTDALLKVAESSDRKIVFADAGSLIWLTGGKSELSDKIRVVDITDISYEEYSRVYGAGGKTYYSTGGLYPGNREFADKESCRGFIYQPFMAIQTACRYADDTVRKKRLPECPPFYEELVDAACTVSEYYCGLILGNTIYGMDSALFTGSISHREVCSKWESFFVGKTMNLYFRTNRLTETALNVLLSSGLLHRVYEPWGDSIVFSQPGMAMCICRELFSEFIGKALYEHPNNDRYSLTNAVMQSFADVLSGGKTTRRLVRYGGNNAFIQLYTDIYCNNKPLKPDEGKVYDYREAYNKYDYFTTIVFKDDIPADRLAELRKEADAAFSNRVSKVPCDSDDPYVLIYGAGSEERGALDLGIIGLEKNKQFMSCVKSWSWTDTDDPSENDDILALAKEYGKI